MYSQNNEESVILEHFGKRNDGSFLDIGAYDGKMFSNTLALAELGWSGVCVEPSPFVFPSLLKLHGTNPRIHLLMAALAAGESKIIPWFDSGGDAVSTTDLDHVAKWSAGSSVRFSAFHIPTVTLAQFFEKFGYGFKFVNIDVESTNLSLFLNMPWESLCCATCVCVEHDGNHAEMASRLERLGYKTAALNAENIILVR